MDLEHQLELIFERLDNIEKSMVVMQTGIKSVDVEEFEKVLDTVGRISPVAMHHPRNKCNVIDK